MSKKPFVSVVMPVRNEADFIRESLGAVFLQDYGGEIEVIVVDGMSDDGTKSVLEELREKHANLKIAENPAKIVPSSMNIGIKLAKGAVIVRVDGHTKIAPDYVRCCVEELESTGADNAGGRMIAEGQSDFSKAAAAATSSVFGIGNARFHYADQPDWVDTVYLGAWPREVFEKNGLFDEELVRNQDDEFNCRIRRNGGRIFLSPKIKSLYVPRQSPRSLWKQYFEYGFWKVRVLQKHPGHMQWRQFVPFLFVAGLAVSFLLGFWSPFWAKLFRAAAFLYAAANLSFSVWEASRSEWKQLLYLPWVYATLHFAYGSGFTWGLFKFSGQWGKSSTFRFVPQNPVLDSEKFLSAIFKGLPEKSPASGENSLLFSRAREAVAAALETRAGNGREVLVPAYICAAVVEAVRRAGTVPVFYELKQDLEPDMKNLESKFTPETRAVIGVRYFGFPCGVESIEAFAKKRGILFIEDGAHVLFRQGETSAADFCVYSFPKFYPVPDGAMLCAAEKINLPKRPEKYDWKTLVLQFGDLFASWLASLAGYPLRGSLRESKGIKKFFYGLHRSGASAEEPVPRAAMAPTAAAVEGHTMSVFSRCVVGGVSAEEMTQKRRRNFSALLDGLKDTPGIEPFFKALPENVCPMAFPIKTAYRDVLRKYLLEQGIETSVIWSGLPKEAEGAGFPAAADLAEHNLAIPVHQDLNEAQIDFIIMNIKRAMRTFL